MSQPVATAAEMAKIDARAIEVYGIPSACLMETAGGRAAAEIWGRFGRRGLRTTVVAGKGNNGGDGFVIARYLMNQGAEIQLFTLFPPEEATGNPAIFLSVLRKMGLEPQSVIDKEGLERMVAAAAESDLLIDAILGTGFRPPARGHVAEALQMLSGVRVPVVAVDIPSGLDASSGAAQVPHMRADLALTFGALKRGQLSMPAAEHTGEVVLLDIGIPGACVAEQRISLQLTEASDVGAMLPLRRRDAHKGDAGQLLLVAGSAGMTGAALMAGMAALRVGTGLVTIALPESLAFPIAASHPEIMTLPLPATSSGTIDATAFDAILEFAAGVDALVVGPGLKTHPRTVELVHRLIQHLEMPMVLDADGLNALAQDLTVLDGTRTELVLTPHPGEMARLVGIPTPEVQKDRVNLVLEFAARHHLHIALKGAGTIVGTPSGQAWFNPTGNPAMATAGMGDVLAGVVGGLLAQSLSPEEALVAGTYLHGLSGDLAAEDMGGVGITAGDLLPVLPRARARVMEEGRKGRD